MLLLSDPIDNWLVTYLTEFIGTRQNYDRTQQPLFDATGAPRRVTHRYSADIGAVLATVAVCREHDVPILARTASLLAHLAEEQEDPIGLELAAKAEEAVEYER